MKQRDKENELTIDHFNSKEEKIIHDKIYTKLFANPSKNHFSSFPKILVAIAGERPHTPLPFSHFLAVVKDKKGRA